MPRKRKQAVPVTEQWKQYNALKEVDRTSLFSCGINEILESVVFCIANAIKARMSAKSNHRNSSRRTSEHALGVNNIAYQFVGHPSKEQEHALNNNIGGSRFFWNRLVADNDTYYKETGKILKATPADYKALPELSWLNTLDSYALCNVQLNYEGARSDWFSGKSGKPRFKKKGLAKASYTTNKDKRCNNISLENGRLTLPKIPDTISVTAHRRVREDAVLKSCTVTHEPSGRWVFTLLYEYPAEEFILSDQLKEAVLSEDISSVRHIGLDMSLPHLYVSSEGKHPFYELEGELVAFENHYHKLEKRIAREQRHLSRMSKHSANYAKQCVRVAKLHAKAKHQRRDFLEQMSARLAGEYDIISIEDLDMSAMKRSLHFGKSISDNGWGMFVQMLERKCQKNGHLLIRVDKWFPSSKTCSHCGKIHRELTLSDRTYICPHCGHAMDRDENAAVNIDSEGLRLFCDAYINHTAAA